MINIITKGNNLKFDYMKYIFKLNMIIIIYISLFFIAFKKL